MITANLIGGLSNQMFQIATCFALAADNYDQCSFPFDAEVGGQGNKTRTYINNIFRNISERTTCKSGYVYREESLDYKPIPYKQGMTIQGYFPSEKYFDHRKEEIYNLFVCTEIIEELQNKYTGFLKNSVSVHIRRGDYVLSPTFLPPQKIEYYESGLKIIDVKKEINNIIVFSDDMQWCYDNFCDERVTFIHQEDYVDLYLMSLCENNIISNSGFSWWASYLNRNTDKIVIAPSVWFEDKPYTDFKGCYRDEMIIV